MPPTKQPANVDEGAARVRALMVKAFDRQDGTGADWRPMLESLFRVGFKIAEEQLDDAARLKLLLRVHEGAYDRISAMPDALGAGSAAPGSTASPDGRHKSPRPKRPRLVLSDR